jgi:YbbR domain-containing protein
MTRNWGTKLISVIVAFVLWIVVLGSRNVEVTKEVQLEVDTSSEFVVANELPDKVAFRLSGPKAFLRTLMDRREDPIKVNLAGSGAGIVTHRFFSDQLRVPIGVKVQSVQPPTLSIRVESVRKRELPVRLEFRGELPDGAKLLKVELSPNRVKVKGAESRIASLTEIVSTPIDLSKIEDTQEIALQLDLARYRVELDGPAPRAVLVVESGAPNLRVRNVEVRVLSAYKAIFLEKTVTVFLRVPVQNERNIDPRNIFATVDLRGKPKGSYIEPVKVNLPEGASLIRVAPEQINVTLK